MTNKVEITPQERARLGRDTMLQWSIKENKAKLKALRTVIGDYLKSGAIDKLEKLRQTIIRNTRKDLEKIKDLTDAQRDKKAKEFADKVIRYVKENKDLNDVFFTSKVVLGPEGPNEVKPEGAKAELLDQWINNNPKGEVEFIEDDPKFLALKEITDQKDRKKAFVLLGLIEKFYGGKEEALKLYKKARNGHKIDLDILREQFSKDKANSTVGFYYGTRKILWDHGSVTSSGHMMERLDKAGFKYTMKSTSLITKHPLVSVTGWWAWDAGEDNKNTIKGGYYVEKDFLRKLRGGGYGDEWMGKDILSATSGSKNNLLKELHKADFSTTARDSGLSRDKEGEVRQALMDLIKVPDLYDSKVKASLLLWFKKNANKWVILEKDDKYEKNIHGQMQFLFGQGVGLFQYRYDPEKKKIFFIRIENSPVGKDWGVGGEIDIKDGKIVKKWNSYDMAETRIMLKEEIIDNMSDEDIKKEVASNKVKAKEGSREEKLNATSRIIYKLKKKLPKNVEHNKLKEGYIDNLEKQLKKYLLKHGYKNKEELAEELAVIRAEHVHKQIIKFIEDDTVLTKAVEENDKEKLTISIDSGDELKVELFDKNARKKWKDWAKQKAEGVKTTAGELAQGTMARLEKKMEKYFGPLTPVVMWILDKVFKIGDAFKKMAKGGTSLIGGLFTSIFGVKLLKDKLRSKKITEEVIEKLPPKKKKFYKFDKKMYFSEDVNLKGKKIVIPKGKGINPGKEFDVKVKGIRDAITVKPVEDKKSLLGGIFGRRNKEKYRLKDSEIILTKGTTIPKGTVIPKGAKIYKA